MRPQRSTKSTRGSTKGLGAFCVLVWLIFTVSRAVSQESNPAAASWQRYTVKGEEFSVTLPTLPAMITTKTFLPRLQKKRLVRVLTVSADGVAYSIYACENPQPRQSLEEFMAGQNAKARWDPASERNLTIGSFPGKEYSSQDKNKPVIEQFFVTEERLYRFVASGASTDHPGVKQFFSSITLGKEQDGIKVSDGPGIPLQSPTAERIFTGKEVDAKARLLKRPEPSYTEQARSSGIAGTVVLKVVFSSTGQVTNIRIVQELPYR